MNLKIGLIGTGTVGKGVYDLLKEQHDFFAAKLGINIEVKGICAKTEEELQEVPCPGALMTTNALEICENKEIQVVVELAGGYDLPKKWITCALNKKKHVVTANKALLAKYGYELFPLAVKNNCFLSFEAAIGGGIPIVKTLQESLIANNIQGLACIINGTCNYILSEMSSRGQDFQTVLKEAQNKGYAEADPVFDIEGTDSAHKVALLASLCFGKYVNFEEMNIEGIMSITKLDVEMAKELGYVIKLLGVVNTRNAGEVAANVYPAMVSSEHQLASVNGVRNAVFLQNSAAGEQLFTGAGAGRYPTASAVVSDIVSIGQSLKSNVKTSNAPGYITADNKCSLIPIEDLETEFYLRLMTQDKTGVLAEITRILADNNISIDSIIQKKARGNDNVPVIIITHKVSNRAIFSALEKIDQLDVVTSPTQLLRFFD